MTNHAAGSAPAKKYWVIAASLVILVATGLLLRAEGRLWICACGTIRVWTGQICSANNSQHFLDPYSFTHVLHGFVFWWLIAWFFQRWPRSWQVVLAIAVEAAWELFENTNFIIDRYRSQTAALGYNGDTVINSFGDLFCCLLGFLVARQLGLKRSLLVFFIVEAVLILWIRDSLLFEILMLVAPVNAIRAWQMCG